MTVYRIRHTEMNKYYSGDGYPLFTVNGIVYFSLASVISDYSMLITQFPKCAAAGVLEIVYYMLEETCAP